VVQMAAKVDFRKTMKALYAPPAAFQLVEVPQMQFVMVDGKGDPNTAADYQQGLSWLFTTSYGMKFASKRDLDRDYTVPPLEALWWAEDMSAFVSGSKSEWQWTQMIMVPDWVTPEMYTAALTKAVVKLGEAPPTLRFAPYAEGLSVQILHIGSYADEAPTLRRLHEDYLPANGLVPSGHHHEIYLSDPRKVAPEKLKTVLRQPVKRV